MLVSKHVFDMMGNAQSQPPINELAPMDRAWNREKGKVGERLIDMIRARLDSR